MAKKTITIRVSGLTGKHGSKEVKRTLAKLPGVLSVSTNTADNRVNVDYDSTGVDSQVILERLRGFGMEAKQTDIQEHIM